MANLLINTTVGGNAVITTSNIGTYALTSLPSHNHDDRYFTETESDGRYAYKAGAAGQDFSVDKLSSYHLRNHYSVSTNHSYGMYFDNDLSTAYGIFRESGAWDHPYPDLRIAFHTGIKLGANSTYQGIKFYTDYDMVTQVMSVNNGSDPLGAGNVYVNNSLQAGSSLRAPIFYDSNDTTYYGDFAGTSNLYNLSLTGAKQTYLTINPGNGYEAMVRYIGGSGSGWYVGKRMASQVVGTESFHFYSEAAGATVAGIDTGGNFFTTGYLTIAGTQLTGTQTQLLKNTLDITSLPYKCDIYVEGNADTFYPVHFIYGNQDVWRRIIINRGYSETAPWDPTGSGSHKGGLLLDWEGNFGGWGGAEYADRLRVFNESYTNMCADMYIYTHSMGYVFMLRGGHAIYHIFSDQPINGTYQSGSPDIAYSTATKFYDGGPSYPQYDVYAPAPLALNQVNSSRIDGLRTKKQSLLDGRYLRQGVDIGSITNISASNFMAANAFYLNGQSYYLNSTNGGIYTNSRFETASNLVVGGNSYLGNASGDETHINDILRVGATDSGDAHFYFGEGSLAGSDYGSHWHWDSGYRFTWNTRNNGTDTALFYYDTNSLSYITWNRSLNMNTNSIDYTGQLHFSGGTRFQSNDTHYLNFKTDATDYGSIQVRDGNNTLKGYLGYYDASGFGLLNSTGNWGIRFNPGNVGTDLFYAGDWKLNTRSGGVGVNGNLYTDQNYGYGLVGVYSSTRYQGVFAMSNDYKLLADGTGTGNLYGIAWTHTNVGGQSKSGLGHQALFMDNGTTQTAIGSGIWTNGLITSIGYGTSSNWNTAFGWGNHASAGYQAASSAITTSNIGSQSVSYATTAGALSSMNISQFSNNSGYFVSSTANTVSVNQIAFSTTNYDFTLAPRLSIGSMSIKLWDNYFNNSGLGSDYGSLLDIYGRGGHVHSQFYMDANSTLYYRMAAYAGGWNGWQQMWTSTSLTNLSQLTNGPGYLTGITSGQVTSALGYTPYNSSNPSGYITSSGSISGNAGTVTNGVYTNSSAAISGDNHITFGPNSTWGCYLRVGGNGRTVSGDTYASMVTTNGNLHLDGGNSRAIYLNYYAGTSGTAFGNGASGVVAWMGSDGDLWKGSTDNSGTQYVYNSGTWSINVTGSAGSISGFNNPTTASTANTIVYRDASGDVAAREFVLTSSTVHTVTPSSIVGIYPTTNQVVKFSASAIQTFLGLGSLAYSSATIPTNNNQLTNGAGYITGISFASVSSKPTTVAGYGITDAITTANIGSQSVSYAATAGSAPNGSNINQFYDVTAGVGNGLRFWGAADYYKISMGVGALYQYGPVTDYSIKTQMNDGDTGRGFTWGRLSYAPIAALNSTSGDMEVAGYYKSYGYRGNGNVGGTGSASWHPDGIYCGSTMWQYGSLYKNNTGIYNVSEMTMNSGPTLSTYNTRNLIVRALDNNADVGILGQKSGGGFAFQIYGTGSSYGFLNGTWAAWDIRKAVNGAMYMNDNDSYYLQTNSTSNFYALNIQGNAVVHAGNISSQSVSYATTAGTANAVAWTNVSSRPTALSQFTNDLGNYGGFLTSITAHSHAISDVTGLQTALDGKQAAGSYAASSHTHDDRYYTESESDTRFARRDADSAISGNLVIGNGTYGNSTAYGSSGARLMFSGSDTDAQGNYYIGTNHNDYGGNYSKLELRWHTGIRMGAQPGYGGIRFYDTEDLGTVIFSVGTGDSHVRVVNNLYVGGNLALHAGNYNSYSPTLTGTGASGTWGISISGNAATATNVAWTGVTSRPTALSQFTNDLGNYGGWITGINSGNVTTALGFTPYNATNPSGYITSSASISGNAATATYATTAGSAPANGGNSTTVGGYTPSGSVGANTVVIRDANNYIYAHYINSNVSETENPTINSFYTSNGDGWLRKSSVAHVKSQLGLGSMAYESSGTYQTVSGAINTGNIASQSVSYATISQQLTKFGDIYGQDWNGYFITGKLIVSNALGHTGANRPSDSYGYGTVLSYGETGGPLMQMYFPEDVGNTGGAYRALAYRSGYNGGWSPWKTVVNQVGNTCTVAGSNGTGLQVHSNVGYNQNPLTYFLLRGQADSSWKTFKILLTGDAGGQDIEFRRIAENNTDARMFYVPRGLNQVIFDYTVVQPSDSRLKDNLTPITNPVDKIKSLRGVEFDWNSGEHVGTHDVGLIAQDVEAVLPEAVTTQEDGYKNLAYTKVIPLLVEAMKEQQTMIEALRAEIELLKNK